MGGLARSLRAVLVAALVASAVTSTVPSTPAAAATREVTLRYSINTSGFTRLRGNSVLECNTARSTTCPTAVGAPVTNAVTNPAYNNNAEPQRWTDVDGDPATFNSSSADVPWDPAAGSFVRFAGLYWGGDSDNIGAVDDPPAAARRNEVRFGAPGRPYALLADAELDTAGPSDRVFQGFVEVTDLLNEAGPGTYTVADLQVAKGFNAIGGWALVVVIEDPREPARNMTVYDGFLEVTGATVNVAVTGFRTPLTGIVRTRLGSVAFEGDRGSVGDQLVLNGTALTDSNNPANNYFNSTISDGLTPVVRNPDHPNTLGLDIDRIQTTLPNGATSATIRLRTSGESYYTGAVTFETELSTPELGVAKAVTDLDGGEVEPGDTLEYAVAIANSGRDAAAAVVLRDVLPPELTYVPGSTAVDGSPRTDRAGDDVVDVVGGTVVARLGASASSGTGGSIAIGDRRAITLRATVGDDLPDRSTIENTAEVTYTGAQTGLALTARGSVTTTVVNPLADLSVTKSGGPFVAGNDAVYTLTVDNSGPQDAAGPLRVVDTLPPGLEYGGATGPGWTCTFDDVDEVTCSLASTLAVGARAPPITLRTAVEPDRPAGVITNRATVASATEDPDPRDDAVSLDSRVDRLADLVVTTGNEDPVVVGIDEDVTTTVTNLGPSSAEGPITVTDTVPPGFAFVDETTGGYDHGDGWTCSPTGDAAVTCTYPGPLGPVESAPLLTIRLDSRGAGPPSIEHRITATSATPDPSPAVATDVLEIVRVADLDLEKTHAGTIGPAEPFVMTLANNGPSPVPAGTALAIVDTLPAGVSYLTGSGSGWTCPAAPPGPSVRCTHVLAAALAPGAALPELRITVDPGVGSLTAVNTATVDLADLGDAFTDPVTANNTAVDSFDTPAAADLAIEQSIVTPADDVVAGGRVTFAVDVINLGPDAAAPVTVSTPIADFLSFVPAGAGSASDPSCSRSGAAPVVCAVGPLLPSQRVRVLVTVDIDPGLIAGLQVNTVQVNSPTADPVAANDLALLEYDVERRADVEVTKLGPPSASPGKTIDYVVTVANSGPSSAEGPIELADPLPAGARFVEAVSDDAWRCLGLTTVACALATPLGPGGSSTVRLRVFLEPDITSLGANTVTVTSVTPDPDGPASNDDDPAVVVVDPRADLSITTRPADAVEAVPGSPFSYEVTVTNAGPATATAPRTVLELPPGVTFADATGGWSCEDDGGTVTCTNTAALGPAASNVFTLNVLVDADVTIPVAMTATVSSVIPDPSPVDNSFALTTPLRVTADLRMDKTARGEFPAGGTGAFTLDVMNAGPSTSPGPIIVTDELPVGLTMSSVAGAGWTCATTGQLVSCTHPAPLAVGPVSRLDLVVDVSPSLAGSVINTATVSGPADDPAEGNEVDVSSGVVRRQVDLGIVAAHTPDPVTAGTGGELTVTVTNDGPATLLPGDVVTVVDTVPAPLVVGALPAGPWSCRAGDVVTCSLTATEPLGAGDALPVLVLPFVVPAAAAAAQVTNEVAVETALDDVDPSDDTDGDPVTIVTSAALEVTKVAGPATVAGETGTFTITVANPIGPSLATAPITVVDDLAKGLSFVAGAAPWTCTVDGSRLTCTLPDAIAVGGTAPPLVVTVGVSSTVTGDVTNTARATSATPDPGPSEGSATLAVSSRADLAVVVTGPPSTVVAGEPLRATVAVSNAGPSTARSAAARLSVPAGFTAVDLPSGCAANGVVVTCQLGDLAPGTTARIAVVLRSPTTVPVGPSVLDVSVASATGDPSSADDRRGLELVVEARRVTLVLVASCAAGTPTIDYRVSANFPVATVSLAFAAEGPETVVREVRDGLPPSGTVLWPGARRDASGRGVAWPGWIEGSPGRSGDDGFLWAQPRVVVSASVNPTSPPVALSYPPATPGCRVDGRGSAVSGGTTPGPREGGRLPSTGADVWAILAAAGCVVLAGVGLVASTRRRTRS